jgi:hypothetical protein
VTPASPLQTAAERNAMLTAREALAANVYGFAKPGGLPLAPPRALTAARKYVGAMAYTGARRGERDLRRAILGSWCRDVLLAGPEKTPVCIYQQAVRAYARLCGYAERRPDAPA